MFDIKTLNKAIEQLASEKDLEVSQVLEAVEAALASAYKKEYEKKGEVIRCHLDSKKGELKFFQVKTVVDETTVRFEEPEAEDAGEKKEETFPAFSFAKTTEDKKAAEGDEETLLPLYNPERHLLLEDAKKIKSDAVVGEEIFFDLEPPSSDFGRIAAQTAKQVVLQKLREIEKMAVKIEFENKTGSLVTGIVQRIERGNVFVDLGKASGVMFFSEAIPGEHYRIGERLKFYLLAVQEGGRGPQLMLSRSHPKFVSKLFELEVPEIADGIVQIKGIVREPGSRTKIAVASTVEGVDPVGACVGQRGARVMAVNNEIGNEKIDIIEWSDDIEQFIFNSLSPATVTSTELRDKHEALVLVPEDQLSLAIGKGGQNVRLAAKLSGYKIDVRSQSNPNATPEGGVADVSKEEHKEEDSEE
jgi:N utilization substance protein A